MFLKVIVLLLLSRAFFGGFSGSVVIHCMQTDTAKFVVYLHAW